MNTLDTEIILNQDGNFYKRSTVTTLLQDQETAIQRVKAKPIFFTSPVMHASQHDNVVGTHVLQFVDGQSKDHMLCSQIKSLPFPGASLMANIASDDDDFIIYTRHDQTYPSEYFDSDVDREVINGREVDIKFTPNQDQALYLLCNYTDINGRGAKSEAPTLFLYDMHHQKSYHLNLPNVFTNKGEICAGEDYPREGNDIHNTLQLHYSQLISLFTSHCNNDLRDMDVEETSLRFRRDGTLIHNDLSDIKHTKFYHDVTRESILNFTTHLNSIYG